MPSYKILCIHGIGHAEANRDWNQPWRDAIVHSFGGANQASLQFAALSYDQIFEQFPSNAAEDAEAVTELLGSAAWHAATDPLQPRAFEPLDAFKYVGRWYAGMVAQWVVDEQLRQKLRDDLTTTMRNFQPDIILAHSLGTLLSFDLFTHDDAGRNLLDGKIYITCGSQIANLFIRARMWAGLVPMVSARKWYHLFNKLDPAFTAPISEPGQARFSQVETDSPAGHSPTAIGGNPGYLDHPNTLTQVWEPISRGLGDTLLSRGFEIVTKATEPPHRRALLVGINEYPDPANKLRGCVNDVYAMSATLQGNGFSPEDISVLLNERATRENILDRLHWLLADCNDQADRIFYYSGHGIQLPGRGTNGVIDHLEDGIVPVDFDWQKLNAITDRDFLDLYSQLPKTSRFLSIFDSCFSGGMVKSQQSGVRCLPIPESIRHAFLQWDSAEQRWVSRKFKSALPGIDGEQKAYTGQNHCTYKLGRAVPLRTLQQADYDAVRKRQKHDGPFLPVVLEACGDDQPSFEYPDGATIHGAFTYALTNAIRQNGSGELNLTFKKLMDAIQVRLRDLGIGQQPQIVGPRKVLGQPIAVWGNALEKKSTRANADNGKTTTGGSLPTEASAHPGHASDVGPVPSNPPEPQSVADPSE
jgi:metacaspase-1